MPEPKPVMLTDAEEDWITRKISTDEPTLNVAPLLHAVEDIVAAREAAARRETAARREALLEAREDIRARRQTFAGLGCDMQYLLAMDDCFGLVNNRLTAALAEPERDEESGR